MGLRSAKKATGLLIWAGIGCLALPLLWVGILFGAQDTTEAGHEGLIPLKVKNLILDPRSGQPVVLLSDPQEERALLIWIGPREGNAIQSELEGVTHARPLTHDLLEKFIRLSDIRLQRVVITHIEEGTYYASIFIERAGTPMTIDARPSDSIVLAQKFKIPLFSSKALFREASLPIQSESDVEEEYGLGLQDLTPSLRKAFSFDAGGGVLISDVQDGSRAAEDGLERGDIITEVAGQAIEDVSGFRKILKGGQAPLGVRLFRKKHYLTLTMHPD